ncbi:hypothetical protein [Hyalangium sp.]|uniref:hypothetical protein n=1 Tax=Hyalangium sp. TaxID=2028555 RepID=UPI002D5C27A9|nr:hypothetical protein [Hyalangium sp.]HYH96182.1 hypothetical protein [Hyalangium sp.]
MRRRILIAMLTLGTIGGYASGFSSLRHRSQCRRAWMEQRASPTCAPCPGGAQTPASASPEAPAPSGPR